MAVATVDVDVDDVVVVAVDAVHSEVGRFLQAQNKPPYLIVKWKSNRTCILHPDAI